MSGDREVDIFDVKEANAENQDNSTLDGSGNKNEQGGEIEDVSNNDIFNDFRLKLIHTFRVHSDDKGPWIRHIEVLSNGNLLLADRSNQQLLLYDNNGIRMKHAKLSSGPWSLAITNSNMAAVTLPDQKIVTLVSADTLKGKTKIEMRDDCRGIACINNKLVINCVTSGIKIITMAGKTLKVFPQYIGYISLLRGPYEHLLCSLFAEDRIICMDMKGNLKYVFRDQSLSGPCSFAMDMVHQYLYVVGHHDNKIHIYHEGGQRHRVLLTKKEGIDRPWATAYDSPTKTLFISTFGGKNISVWKVVEEEK